MTEENQETIIDRFLSRDRPILDFLRQPLSGEVLTEEQERLAQSFREGIAQAIGIPPEYIRDEPVTRWVLGFTRAFVKPEYYKDTIAPSLRQMRLFGQEIGNIIREGIEQIDKEPKQKRLIDKLTKEPPSDKDIKAAKKEERVSNISLG